ncbi:MAG: 5'-methylthioadenosine/S-adenosylhomocysteine nucleosidase [Chloroflexota bacterium]|nr:5'-methylthioadenosine/S-adenosylhomocysteine nucleosidase [Chloroflexota bacterium]
MVILAMVPTQRELDSLTTSMKGYTGYVQLGRVSVQEYFDGKLLVSLGGVGKAQMAAQSQYLIDRIPGLRLLICAGTAGALISKLYPGDLIVATSTIEHDFISGLVPAPQPEFFGDANAIAFLQSLKENSLVSFRVKFGSVASGDESVISSHRKESIYLSTRSYAVAFEGAGAARACEFSMIPFLELRAISDSADENAKIDFFSNIPLAMGNIGTILEILAEVNSTI